MKQRRMTIMCVTVAKSVEKRDYHMEIMANLNFKFTDKAKSQKYSVAATYCAID